MKTPQKRNHDRAEENTGISVSMTKELRDRIKKAAAREDRTVSSFLRVHLSRVMDEIDHQEKGGIHALDDPQRENNGKRRGKA